MKKDESIKRLQNGHQYFKRVIGSFGSQEKFMEKVLGEWTVKDVICHLSAWNWEQIGAFDSLLKNIKPVWWGLDEKEFNQKAVDKRKDWTIEAILKEWEDSFAGLISRMSKLTEKEWSHEAGPKGEDGKPVTIEAMFDYSYRGEDHEGGHAKQIEEAFKERGDE